jgi:hypothetical protein
MYVLATVFVAGVGSTAWAQPEPLTCEDARCRFQQQIIEECQCSATCGEGGIPCRSDEDCASQAVTTCSGGSDNHGAFVSCAAHAIKEVLDSPGADDLPNNCHGKLQRCAARSVCGKQDRGFHTCTRVEYGTCVTSDTLTGEGACEHDGSECITNTDCVVSSRCKVTRHPESCEGEGKFLDLAPTCCSNCVTEE